MSPDSFKRHLKKYIFVRMNFIKLYLLCFFFKILALKTKQLRLHMYIYTCYNDFSISYTHPSTRIR